MNKYKLSLTTDDGELLCTWVIGAITDDYSFPLYPTDGLWAEINHEIKVNEMKGSA